MSAQAFNEGNHGRLPLQAHNPPSGNLIFTGENQLHRRWVEAMLLGKDPHGERLGGVFVKDGNNLRQDYPPFCGPT